MTSEPADPVDRPSADEEGSGTGSEPSGDFVQSFARGLAVIRAFDADHAELTLSEVAVRAEMPRAAARRFLATLVSLGYVRTSDRAFALTPRVLELGYSYLSALSLPEVAQPHLEGLSHELDESTSLAVLDGTDVVYVARVPTRRIMSVSITIGTRFPAWATSLGRVLLAALPDDAADAVLAHSDLRPFTPTTLVERSALLAELDRVRRAGWAMVDGELEEGLRSIAAPVRDASGAVVAAVNVSTARRGDPESELARVRPALQRATVAIEADLRIR
ncbi:MAG: IclR family transcriptional regulator C-terminal domain-containing protein [Microcella sp.]|uniref:IclR family transcriptional regulator domain-containing protein n=1 Tax=Microcella sp. TaxID=1913979 RepID=UPI00271733AE|nr:IclR family transcriptional regulator C-terminal domain-containing protein [Microcella sp.]MDO8337551.1 IclR family transcriptional regulator C-terminal domain-containing protein [Microcella sp.]